MAFNLSWDNTGERYYETGVDHGVVYPMADNAYPKGYAWSGLSSVQESPSGAEATAIYADNIKYLNLISNEDFGATIEAYNYPKEFAECDGSANLGGLEGVYVAQQNRKKFGFSYRTIVGNDASGNDYGYKLHLVYGCTAAPSEKSFGTVNDSPEAITFSWTLSTTPANVGVVNGVEYKPTACITIDSTKVDPSKLAALENILYGQEAVPGVSDAVDARLPMPAEVYTILTGAGEAKVELNVHTARMTVGDTITLTATTAPAAATVTWTSASTSVADVTGGVVSAEGAGNTIVTASITVDGVTYTDTCTVIVSAA